MGIGTLLASSAPEQDPSTATPGKRQFASGLPERTRRHVANHPATRFALEQVGRKGVVGVDR